MRIIVCDDNEKESGYFQKLVKSAAEGEYLDIEITPYQSSKAMLFALEDEAIPADIMLLDIHMPGINGMDMAKKIRHAPYSFKGDIIFITVDQGYALDGYDVHAFNFIIKGQTTRGKAIAILKDCLSRAARRNQEYMLLKGVGEYRNLLITDIYYFEAFQRIVAVHYGDDQTFEFYSQIGKLETAMISKGFVRIHRSYLVAIAKIQAFTSSQVKLEDGTELPVGRTYKDNLKLAMQNP